MDLTEWSDKELDRVTKIWAEGAHGWRHGVIKNIAVAEHFESLLRQARTEARRRYNGS